MPLDGRLREMTYIPGRLFSVNFATARTIPGLFTRNERLVCLFDTVLGPMALILVGAMLVSGMETVWSGVVSPPHGQAMGTWRYADGDAVQLPRGGEMGCFRPWAPGVTRATTPCNFPGAEKWAASMRAPLSSCYCRGTGFTGPMACAAAWACAWAGK